MDELSALLQFDGDFRRCNLMCFTETHLNETIPDSKLALPGYNLIRGDRIDSLAEKDGGGGVCMYVSEKWATQFKVHERVCTHDYELLTVSFRPFYLPREFGQLTVILVYVPGPHWTDVAEKIADSYDTAVTRAPDQPVFITGDFNRCKFGRQLPNLHQYVDCSTRLDAILDKCFGNIEHAYKSVCRPPLGRSDHNVIQLTTKVKILN